jgi:hypothetical protein
LIDSSDAVLLQTDQTVGAEFIKMILRKSKHLYLKRIPNFNIRETLELIDLEKEAGVVSYLYNPFGAVPFFNPSQNRYEKPCLINLRTSFEFNSIRPSHELMLLITAINRMVRSSFKKLEIFGINNSISQIMVNIRVEYKNGSVANLTITQEKTPGYCEIFDPSQRVRFNIPNSLFTTNSTQNAGLPDLNRFVRMIDNHEINGDSFDALLGGVQIVSEIREHLRFNEISF